MREQQKLTFAKSLRTNMTDAEKKLWYHLRANRFQGLKFVRQKPMGPYIVDFCCCSKKLVIELDGGQHGQQVEYDARRTDYLNGLGYRVIRFSDTEALKNITSVLEQIALSLTLPRKRGRENIQKY